MLLSFLCNATLCLPCSTAPSLCSHSCSTLTHEIFLAIVPLKVVEGKVGDASRPWATWVTTQSMGADSDVGAVEPMPVTRLHHGGPGARRGTKSWTNSLTLDQVGDVSPKYAAWSWRNKDTDNCLLSASSTPLIAVLEPGIVISHLLPQFSCGDIGEGITVQVAIFVETTLIEDPFFF